MVLIGQSKSDNGVTSIGFIFSAAKFLRLGDNFVSKLFGVSGTLGKCGAKFLGGW